VKPKRTGAASRTSNPMLARLDEKIPYRLVGVLSLSDRQHHRFTHGLNVSFSDTRRPLRVDDRHRGGGRPPAPATPPCIRVRTRRFERAQLARAAQRG
jgi:hypothetical protein